MPGKFHRPLTALVALGSAAVMAGLSAVPAQADQVRRGEWWLHSLSITSAWATSEGSGVTVAVLSDGVDASQADLSGAVSTAPALPGAPAAAGQYLAADGTPIASLIAGRGHGPGGRSGLLGVAPDARILAVQVTLPADDPELSQLAVASAIPAAIASGIRYAVAHGATVIDLPIDPGQPGSSGTGGATAAAGGSIAEQTAVAYALAHNVVLVAPAGDDGNSSDAVNYPAAYRGVIAVGAFNSAFIKAAWSSHQSYVTLTAGGAGVTAAAASGGYLTMNSTSAASAMVAGVAALIRARYPSLTAADVRKALVTSTRYRPAHSLEIGSGYGTVDAEKALGAAAALATPARDTAGAQARTLLQPAAVHGVSAPRRLEPQVLRAAEISGALLAALLLLLTAAYAAARRRRRRRMGTAQPTGPEWLHRQGQSRYPQARITDADRMLEVFAAPLAAPGQPVTGTSPTPRALPAGPGVAGVFATATERPDAGTGSAPAPDDGTLDASRVLSHGPASRAVNRRPAVSGAPPWEPAAAPKGELPWTAGLSPDAGSGWTAVHPRHDAIGYAAAEPGSGRPGNTWADRPILSPPTAVGSGEAVVYGAVVPEDDSVLDGDPRSPGHAMPQGDPVPHGDVAPQGDPVPHGDVVLPGVKGDALRQRADQFGELWRRQADARWQAAEPTVPWADRPAGTNSAPADQPWSAPPAQPWSAPAAEPWSAPAAQRWSAAPAQPWSAAAADPQADRREPWAEARPPGPYPLPGEEEPGPAGLAQYRIAPSGLPVRQPRATQQAPLSPSGSLWERSGSSLWDRAEQNPAAEGPDSGDQMSGWDRRTADD